MHCGMQIELLYACAHVQAGLGSGGVVVRASPGEEGAAASHRRARSAADRDREAGGRQVVGAAR